MDLANEYAARAAAFKKDAHSILVRHESSLSRVVQMDESYARLKKLTIKQDDLMRQAFRCVEAELFRAAHVMAWSAFMDFYEEILSADGMLALRRERPKWTHTGNIEELREYQGEHSLLELAQPLGLAMKNDMKALQALLAKRNQCAHPSAYSPDLNASLGYMSDLLHYFDRLAGKVPT